MSEERKSSELRADAPPYIPGPILKREPSVPVPEIESAPVGTDTFDFFDLSKPVLPGEYSSLSEIINVPIFYECLKRSCLNTFEGFEPVFIETMPPEIIINFILRNDKDESINTHITFHSQSMVGNETHLRFALGEIIYKFINIPDRKILVMEEIKRSRIINDKIDLQITRIIQCLNEIFRDNYEDIVLELYVPLHPIINAQLKYKTEQYNNYLSNYNNLTSYIRYLQKHSTLMKESKRKLIVECEQKIREINEDIIMKLEMHPHDFFDFINSFQKLEKSSVYGHYKKYLKYKNKYLNLKNKLNK